MPDSVCQPCRYCGGIPILNGDRCSDKADILVGYCPTCGLTHLATFDHISVEHYKADTYFPVDLEAWRQREQRWNRKRVQKLIEQIPDIVDRKVLDYGCGSGGFLYQARERFHNLSGFDLSSRICSEHRAAGFECYHTLVEVPKDIEVIVLFHVLEHIPAPWDLLSDLRTHFRSCRRFVIEVPNNDEALLSIFTSGAYRRSHYSADHLYYFTPVTLRNVALRAGLMPIIETQLQRYTLANTFGWLRHNAGGSQNVWKYFNDEQLNDQYERILVEQGAADSIFFVCEVSR